MKTLKKIFIAVFVIIAFLFMTCEESEPQGNLTPYMSDIVMMPTKVYAKQKQYKGYKSLGKYTLTAYCGCSKCTYGTGLTATGKKPKANHTIAVDPKVIPYGTKIKIGKRVYVAEDCGGTIKGKHIDIYFKSHKKALKFGIKKKRVYVKLGKGVSKYASNNRN